MAARKECTTGNFFGKSFPRAIGRLGDENKLVMTDDGPQLPNAPLLRRFPLKSHVTFGLNLCEGCLGSLIEDHQFLLHVKCYQAPS